MADYANLNFENYIPDKDINEKILTENPVPSNLQEVPVLDDFVNALLVLQTVLRLITKGTSLRKRFGRLWVRCHDSGRD